MVHVELLSLLGLTAMFLAGTEARCSSTSEIECHRDSQCIAITSVCDSAKQCSDGSDEDPYVCETWTRTDPNCGVGLMYCGRNCRSIPDVCIWSDCRPQLNSRMCEVNAGSVSCVPI
ncbi:very low-density lipoprotein receptor-like [Procambarus clarkii]|uniref:very low-density lipoprotein receptor-like n=1 Tax=Procambarus clarkii TaxID=6728 RepID=UPI0037422A32